MTEEKAEMNMDNPEEQATIPRAEETAPAGDQSLSEQDIDKVLSAMAEKNRQLEEITERYKRLQADFDNFRRRTQKEKEELSVIVAQNIVLQFLPVMDNFERAIVSSSSDEGGLRTGVEMIYRQFSQAIEKLGVEPIAAAGTSFDPQLHEAVMSVEDAGKEDGTVAEELQKGYLLKGKVIRPSMVKVVRNN